MPLWKGMSERLSPQGSDLKILCDNAAKAVAAAVEDMAGTSAGGLMVKMGADGTPTKQIDRAAENAVLDTLRASGLGFKVLSEEIGEVTIGEKPDYFLHLDPLDGTFNAISGIPFYSVSIYLSRGDFHFGYICDLAGGTSFYAEAGRGAYARPGGSLHVSSNEDLPHFSISAYTLRPHTGRIAAIGDTVRRIRTLGSTALEMALVASGRLDAFIDLRGMMRVVDIAAGKIILEEAGGVVTDGLGNALQLDGNMWQKRDLIGSNGLRHAELLRLIGGGQN
ncbi:MAG: bifunctional fructose-bisphosphatase/inositol-phosphate phosphatase [Methanothrix sp.]|nr:bifunctional fructose-bisphosphatase/inositol-phosphate phosphatase [Methanothrix sp.]